MLIGSEEVSMRPPPPKKTRGEYLINSSEISSEPTVELGCFLHLEYFSARDSQTAEPRNDSITGCL